jgi:hypothetical protein
MFYDQYGDDAGPDQGKIESQGKPYVDKGWAKLDTIKSATLLPNAPAAASKTPTPAKKPAVTGIRFSVVMDLFFALATI